MAENRRYELINCIKATVEEIADLPNFLPAEKYDETILNCKHKLNFVKRDLTHYISMETSYDPSLDASLLRIYGIHSFEQKLHLDHLNFVRNNSKIFRNIFVFSLLPLLSKFLQHRRGPKCKYFSTTLQRTQNSNGSYPSSMSSMGSEYAEARNEFTMYYTVKKKS